MGKQTLGTKIALLRKEKGMTQAELAEKMGVTDKAVSKWERNLSCPDIGLLPKLAEVFEISLDELMQISVAEKQPVEKTEDIVLLVCKAVALAMGVAVVGLSAFGQLDVQTGISFLGIGLACVGIVLLREK